MVESVQGEGGAKRVPDGYLLGVRAAADEFGALLLLTKFKQALAAPDDCFLMRIARLSQILLPLQKGWRAGFQLGQ